MILLSGKANFLTIKTGGQHQLIIKKSKFIANLARTETVTEAEEFISKIKQKYKDATHNTYAYIVDLKQEQVKASDNGEPAGTAGIPELKALQLMQLKNVTVVVTRYFGGIKLGAGGLIRAYSNSVTQAVEAVGVVKCVWQQEYIFSLSYHHLAPVQHYLRVKKISISHIEYAAQVKTSIFLPQTKVEPVQRALTNLLAGQVHFIKGKQRYHELPVSQHNFHEQ